jgi:hypothetical protein
VGDVEVVGDELVNVGANVGFELGLLVVGLFVGEMHWPHVIGHLSFATVKVHVNSFFLEAAIEQQLLFLSLPEGKVILKSSSESEHSSLPIVCLTLGMELDDTKLRK